MESAGLSDRQYSPFIFQYEGQTMVPAESVYAAFESKQTIDAKKITYASKKVGSVRRLLRTSLPIPHAGGAYPAKIPGYILGGFLAFENDWNPPLDKPMLQALEAGGANGRLDLGCIAAHGTFGCDAGWCYTIIPQGKPATAFLFELIARLQELATVPMIDLRAYARWLASNGWCGRRLPSIPSPPSALSNHTIAFPNDLQHPAEIPAHLF